MIFARINTGTYTQTKDHLLVAMLADVEVDWPIEVGGFRRPASSGEERTSILGRSASSKLGVFWAGSSSGCPLQSVGRWCMTQGHSFRKGLSRIASNNFRVHRRRHSMLIE